LSSSIPPDNAKIKKTMAKIDNSCMASCPAIDYPELQPQG